MARTACNLHRVLVIRVIERDMYGAIVQKGYVLSAAVTVSGQVEVEIDTGNNQRVYQRLVAYK